MYYKVSKNLPKKIQLNRLLLIFALFTTIISCTTGDDDLSSRIDKSVNLRSLGDSAHDLLSDEKFTSINIEIAYVAGYAPNPDALKIFKSYLERRTFKPDGININLRSVESSGLAPFEIDEIVDIEKTTRTTYNAGDEIAVFIYYADGSNEDDEDSKVILGSAFRNTSMVIYTKTIEEFVAKPGNPSRKTVEAAVLNHEFGHLLGLVDIGSEAQSDHADSENDGHCTARGCLMRSSIEFGYGIANMLDENGVPMLDAQCITDLQANGGR
ncbi:hypothetical protein RM553_09270 [Zunongwangia sp. F363]|uniref:Membrane metalloprotease n=1 Tax=Autumnicola tepida TaxID=3075595 RepID=A0ABU3CAE1_9FLAO|nr:hypothetical protein [Zunongwangia sp. F363]MDT0643015.1 hypothetical protein [Zunongwangia sp. F363]